MDNERIFLTHEGVEMRRNGKKKTKSKMRSHSNMNASEEKK